MNIVDGQLFACLDVDSGNAPAPTPAVLTHNRSTVWLTGVGQERGQGVQPAVPA